jgi:hypothetical protein
MSKKSVIQKNRIKHINELNTDCLNLVFAYLQPFREQVRIERGTFLLYFYWRRTLITVYSRCVRFC